MINHLVPLTLKWLLHIPSRVFNEADLQRSALHLAQSLFKVLIPEESPPAKPPYTAQSRTVPIGQNSARPVEVSRVLVLEGPKGLVWPSVNSPVAQLLARGGPCERS
ncbi:hypothetical protein R1flu_027377 [Riccia fluitans]|uniref:Uncharacterized protein n=1 Tax=Riccia fluitans TaxID=41844 RepID=A0ABD1XJ69_9MARC